MNTIEWTPNDDECPHNSGEESYCDIKNRAPVVIKTWQELMDGYLDQDRREEAGQ